MYRTYHSVESLAIHRTNNLALLEQKIAIHEAGHITAICLRNQQLQLPPVFFQLHLYHRQQQQQPFAAQIEGGYLIDNLAVAAMANHDRSTTEDHLQLQQAYEADVINLLAGPIAEALFLTGQAGRHLEPTQWSIEALKYYGGHSDIVRAQTYLDYFIDTERARQCRLQHLFIQSLTFIQRPEIWDSLMQLALVIGQHPQPTLSCEHASLVLDNAMAACISEANVQKAPIKMTTPLTE